MHTTTLADLEKAVAELTPDDLVRFRTWFEEFDAARFDGKIERECTVWRARPSRRSGAR
jgi:hypothetical protein